MAEITQDMKISGAKQVIESIEKVARATRQMGEATQKSSEEAHQANRTAEQTKGAQKDLADSAAVLVAEWSSMLAVGGLLKTLLEDITKQSLEAVAAMKSLAEVSRGLSTNLGGKVADRLVNQVNLIAGEAGMDVAGRNALVDAMGAATDVRDMNDEDQVALSRNLATLDRATGLRGKSAFKALQTITSRLGVSDETAVDMLASMVNQGVSGDMVQRIVHRGGDARFLGLVSQARGSMDTDDIGRQFDSIANAMMGVDEAGNIKPELEALGLTNEMKPFDRLQFLTKSLAGGQINEGQFMQATGGPQASPLMNAFREAMGQPGSVEAATSALADPQAAEREIAKLMQSPRQQNREKLNRAELRTQIAKETKGMSNFGMNAAMVSNEFDAEGVVAPLRALTEQPIIYATGVFADEDSIEESDRANMAEIARMSGVRAPGSISQAAQGLVNHFRRRRFAGGGIDAATGGVTIYNTNYINSSLQGVRVEEQEAERINR